MQVSDLSQFKKLKNEPIKKCRDKWTNRRIKNINHSAAVLFSTAIKEAETKLNIQLRITYDGNLRGEKLQNSMYGKGRTEDDLKKNGVSPKYSKAYLKKVTNARWLESYHCYGLALDLCLMENGIPNFNITQETADIFRKYGIKWGGDFGDKPHFQIDIINWDKLRNEHIYGSQNNNPKDIIYRVILLNEGN